ncbi:MAG: transcription-repair coupling factor [Reinekea sp.]|jgi:transcription-repair coupling factor (superfamily II helicase)
MPSHYLLRMRFLPFTAPSQPEDKKTLSNLIGSAKALAIAELMESSPGTALIIVDSPADLETLATDLSAFRHNSNWKILTFPDWETLPYDNFSPHEDIISERLAVLNQLKDAPNAVVLATAANLCHRLAPVSVIQGGSFDWHIGQTLNINSQRQQLEKAGYRATDNVYEHGEYTVRGSLLDVYPMGSELPVRVELFDDEIESIRWFDPETQRTTEKIDSIKLLPGRELPLNEEGINRFRKNFRDRFDTDFAKNTLYKDVSEGIPSPGVEYYLPLFYAETSSFFDYLPDNALCIYLDGLSDDIDRYWQEIRERHENRRHDIHNPILEPAELFLPKDQFFSELNQHPRLILNKTSTEKNDLHLSRPEAYPIDHRATEPLNRLDCFLKETEHRILFCAESSGRREALRELLKRISVKPTDCSSIHAFFENSDIKIGLTTAPISTGLVLDDFKLTLVSESQLFGEYVAQRRRRHKTTGADNNDQVIKSLTELRPGAPVVHLDHGIGRYLGLEMLEVDEHSQEFLMLEYAEGSKLYVPVSNLHLISRYSGADVDYAPMHKLGNDRWVKTKRKAAEKIRDTAAELLDIYARREAQVGHNFKFDQSDYQTFAADFGFEETEDQMTAIENVIHDMKQNRPMDRLICGDVGFGKTEVALRAAFIAAITGKQVALLVPTTLLAQQHFETFQDRFADWPIKVDVLSRFNSTKKTNSILESLTEGKIDIIIGTHKLIQKDVKFKDLGLLIIDEEHRFGVAQKEKIKALRANVDILALTATPIPRTMNMSMSGVRDLSIIATPPARRLSVKTFVREKEDALTKEAILREILRGGQVYFLHNEISTIEKTQSFLADLVPEARVVVAHGQMPERQLEHIMSDFYHKRFNVLLCTTIIETGIDVPSANTIIIERADKFGLAQLHQLRGRVGRSHHQAYAYLLTPSWNSLTKDAQKRLEAIAESQHLGAGFTLATHDLEIRGAGELLGEEQSGHIEGIGFALYMDLLNKAVASLKKGESLSLEDLERQGADVNLRIPAIIPGDYIQDVNTRLSVYKRIATVKDKDEMQELQVEMIDRFGLLPEPVKNLCRQTLLRLSLEKTGIERVDMNAKYGTMDFGRHTTVDPIKIVQMVQTQPHHYALNKGTQLRFTFQTETAEQRFATIETILAKLTESVS